MQIKLSRMFTKPVIFFGLLSIFSGLVFAQNTALPSSQPLRILVGSVPGASSDSYARIISEPMAKILGQSVLIENRSGASGIIATNSLVTAPADGQTLQLIYTPHTLSPYLFKKLNYDPIKDVTGVTMIVGSTRRCFIYGYGSCQADC